MSGYFTVASSLNDFFNDNGPVSAGQLRELTTSDCAKIFSQNLNNAPVKELMQHFAAALNHLGQCLHENFEDDFDNLVAAANASCTAKSGI